MKRMIFCTLMCALVSFGAMAQTQDSVALRRSHSQEGKQMHLKHQDCKKHGKACRFEQQKQMDKQELTAEQKAQMKAKYLKEKLTLTDKQEGKIYKVFLAEAQSIEKSKAESSDKSKEAKREEFRALKLNTDKQVKQILSDEQYAKYEQMAKARRGGHGAGGDKHFRGDKGEKTVRKG